MTKIGFNEANTTKPFAYVQMELICSAMSCKL